MKKVVVLILVLKVTNGFFFVDPLSAGARPVFDNRFWKNFENGMKKLEDTFKSTSHDVSDEEDTEADSSDETEQIETQMSPHETFNMFPFFGMTPSRPWWLGKNVCVTKEETDLAQESEANVTSPSSSAFGMSTRMETCAGSTNRYTCTTTLHGPGKHVRTTVKYECCHGFAIKAHRCVQVRLVNWTEAARDAAPEFARMLETTGLLDKLEKSENNFTLFVTADQALDDLRENFDQINQLELLVPPSRRRRAVPEVGEEASAAVEGRAESSDMAPALSKVLQNHIVQDIVHSADFTNNKMMETMSGHKLRMNVFPGGLSAPVLTVNCRRVVKADRTADKGVLHVLDGVLKPVHRSVAQILREDERFSIFRSMLESADLMDRLHNDTVTVFAPTDEAFRALSSDLSASHASCSDTIARHHIVPRMLCMSALNGWWSVNALSDELLRIERTSESITVDGKKISLADVVGTNGVVHVVDSVIMPDSARKINEILESRNLTTFQKLLSEAGISGSEADVTWFAPREEAFNDPEVLKVLEEARADPVKLKELVLYHSSHPKIDISEMENGQEVKTRSGDLSLHFNMYRDMNAPMFESYPRPTLNCARMRLTESRACGANVHEIERLLIPPSGHLLANLNDKPEFSILRKVIEKASLGEDLTGSGPITLLAPTDDAFNDLPARVLNALLANETLARQVLEKHILPESVCCHSVVGPSWFYTHHVETKAGSRLQARRDSLGNVHFGRTRVTKCDQLATNGIAHTVNKVLVPREEIAANHQNPFEPFMNMNGWRLRGHQNPNVDVMLFGI